MQYKKLFLIFILTITMSLSGCGQDGKQHDNVAKGSTTASQKQEILITGDGIEGEWKCDLQQLAKQEDNLYEHVYSAINNWPSPKVYIARGVPIETILQEAGVYDTFQTVTFQGEDGYQCTMTRKQVLCDRFYYPHLQEDSPDEAEPVEMLIALETAEDTDDFQDLVTGKSTLIFGQNYFAEHNSPGFVEDIKEIIVSANPAEQWAAATTFPEAGAFAAGETVKLQHPQSGLVKMFYTTDGSDPTEDSKMYNPSTYQTELNTPIPIEETTTIKVLVTGYGKENSEIATFQFTM